MEETTRREFRLHLPGLLRVLTEHLYSSKHVGVRELIQNAHDSCLRRSVRTGDPEHHPRVDLRIDRVRETLVVSDNGSGLTADELDEYLSTIGRSYTRELRADLSLMSQADAERLIGQFGFGFLSAFLLASEVTLETRSYQPASEPMRWRSVGDEHYEVRPGSREEPGTTVELRVKPSASFVLHRQLLIESVRRYADFLPIPVHVDDDPFPVNLMRPPWDADDPQAATLEYIERTFRLDAPLCVIPLRDHVVDLGHDTATTPLDGFLFIPPGSVASIQEYGDVRVHIRGMFITDAERDLLPPWARFVRGVIESPALQPTASRESVHQDEAYDAVQRAVEEQLGTALREIAEKQPATWRAVVRGHSDVVLGWAVRDDAFFEQVADIVPFRTSRGQLSLPEYLELTDGTVYYIGKELGSLQEQLLAEAHDVPVIDASRFVTEPFLQRYASWKPNVSLERLDADATRLLRSVPEEPFDPVLAYYRSRGVRARAGVFHPDAVPALMIYPEDADFILETRGAVAAGELPEPIAGLIGEYAESKVGSEEELRGTLYVNARSPIMGRLARMGPSPRRDAALGLVLQLARLFAGRTLDAAGATAAFMEVSACLEEMAG